MIQVKIAHYNCWTNHLDTAVLGEVSAFPVSRSLDPKGATSTVVLMSGNLKSMKHRLEGSQFDPYDPHIMGEIPNTNRKGTLFVRFKFKSSNSIYKTTFDDRFLYSDVFYEGNIEVWRFLVYEQYAAHIARELKELFHDAGRVLEVRYLAPDQIYDPYVMCFLNFQFSEKVRDSLKGLWSVGYFSFPRANNALECSEMLDLSKAYISKLSRALQTKILEAANR